MRTSLKSFLLLGALSLSVGAVAAPGALGAEACPNEQLRAENNSTALPDCRAYELVSPDLNHARLTGAGRTSPDGNAIVYNAVDASAIARSGQPFDNFIRSTRDPGRGWSGASLSPPLFNRVNSYQSFSTQVLSEDLSSTFIFSDQPLSAGVVPSGQNSFIGRADGSYQLLTSIGMPTAPYGTGSFYGGNSDFSRVYFGPRVPQLPADPGAERNMYSWTAANGLSLVGILPDGTPAPNGARPSEGMLKPFSTDGRYVAFYTEGKLYLRIDESRTVEIGPLNLSTQEFPPQSDAAGVTTVGDKVLFTSRSALTSDANTGPGGGIGRDLYSYDTASGGLTDLTVDTNPADAAAGADVQTVLAATPDGSYIYFTAKGKLADDAISGQPSLYVWHAGKIDLVADAAGLYRPDERGPYSDYLTPDGQHFMFASTDSLTGYTNTDPVTAQPHAEVFLSTFGAGIVCVSCRVDGSRPTANTDAVAGEAFGAGRAVSNDGRRVFFTSADAVVPQASSGDTQVFEYEDGRVSPISRLDSPFDAHFLDASASGDDVFFSTFDSLVPGPTAGDNGVFDARVNGGFPGAGKRCSGMECRSPATLAPPASFVPPTATFSGAGNLTPPGPTAGSPPKPLTRAQKLAKALRACTSKPSHRRHACRALAKRRYGKHSAHKPVTEGVRKK